MPSLPQRADRQKASTDAKIDELYQKWSDRLNRLEALLLAKTLDQPQEPTFQTIKVAATHSPPAGVVRSTEPFIKPTDPSLHQSTDDQLPKIYMESTLLLQSNSLPVNLTNLTPTGLRRQTDQRILSELAPTPLFCRGTSLVELLLNRPEKTVCLV